MSNKFIQYHYAETPTYRAGSLPLAVADLRRIQERLPDRWYCLSRDEVLEFLEEKKSVVDLVDLILEGKE